MHKNTFYVTTPIYYVNAQPHIGSLYSTLLADVAMRWHQLYGKETFFLTGTDEHGQKIAQAARAAHKDPQEFVDQFAAAFQKMWKAYEIDYSYFVRTTDKNHIHAVQEWIRLLQEKGDIYKGMYTGYYCVSCETFVTEKDIDDAATPACTSCGRITTALSEECYFFRLSAYQDKLLKFYQEHPDFITPAERLNEVIQFVSGGLKDLSISRTTITWGIPFPGDDKHTTYVWADALNNYITSIGYGDAQRIKEFEKWWPAQLQVLGKDIVRFHAVYWPAFLMASGLALPERLLVHGWLKMGDQKMSKSLGNVIDPQQLLEKYGADPVRYYLTRYMAVTQDSPFSIEDLEHRITTDLANDVGNLLHRMRMLIQKHQMYQIAAPAVWGDAEKILYKEACETLDMMCHEMSNYFYHRAYGHLSNFVGKVNAYFHAQEPWKVAARDKARFEEIISATCHSLYIIGMVSWPVMPSKMGELLGALGLSVPHKGINYLKQLHAPWQSTFAVVPLQEGQAPLFVKYEKHAEVKLEETKIVEKNNMTYSTIDDFNKIELRVGTIEAVDAVPKSEKLYKLQVNFGEFGMRQICSGVRQHFAPEDLLGKQAVVVFNLEPRKLMGLESQGMMLFAEDAQGKLERVTVGAPVPNGTRLR